MEFIDWCILFLLCYRLMTLVYSASLPEDNSWWRKPSNPRTFVVAGIVQLAIIFFFLRARGVL